MSLYTDLSAAVASVTLDAGLFRDITQGPATGAGSETITENGTVWSLAKAVQYIINTGDTAIAGFNEDGAAAIAAFNADAATALVNLQDAIDAITADVDTALKSQTNVFTGANTFNGVTLVATAATTADTLNAVNVTMLRAFAAKKTANPANALPGYAVDGADLRVNATGGMRYADTTDATELIPLSGGAFSLTWVGTPLAGRFCQVKQATSAHAGFFVYLGNLYCEASSADSGSLGAAPSGIASYEQRFDPTTGTYTFYVNDATTPIYTSAGGQSPPVAKMPDGWATAFTGFCLLSRITNFALTADEAEGAAKGESRGRLAHRGSAYTGTQSASNAGAPTGTFSITGGEVTHTETAYGAFKFALPGPVVNGMTVRVRGIASAAPVLNILDFAGPTVRADPTNVNVTAGVAFDRVYTIKNTPTLTTDAYLFFETGTTGDTCEIYDITIEGTVAAYAPENCTSLNRWLDASGNNYHLLPVGGAKALNPQPVDDRKDSGRFNLDTLATEVAGTYVTAVRQVNPGVMRLTWPLWMTTYGSPVLDATCGFHTGDPCVVYGGEASSTTGDIYCYKVNGTPGLQNNSINWAVHYKE